MNCGVGLVNCFFVSSPSLPWQHGRRQQGWYIRGTLKKQFTKPTPQLILGRSIPQMKAGDVPFHLPYGSLICTNRLQSDRSKCRGMLVDPGTPRGNAEIRCFEPDLNDIFLLRKLKFLISLDSPRSPPSNEIW